MNDELPPDDVDARVIYMPDERVWQVLSRTEGEGFRTIDTLVDNGVSVLVCDCPAGYMGHRRGPCFHIKLVARWIAAHGDQSGQP